jgi:hypothetical protein
MAAEKEKAKALAEIERTIENEQREAGEKIARYCVKIEEKENSIKKDRRRNGYLKVPGKWRKDMKRAFERINARAFTTPEGLRLHPEI